MKKIIEYILTKVFKQFDYYSIKTYIEKRLDIAYINTISSNNGSYITMLVNRAYKEMAHNKLNDADNTINEINSLTSQTFPAMVRLNVCRRFKNLNKSTHLT